MHFFKLFAFISAMMCATVFAMPTPSPEAIATPAPNISPLKRTVAIFDDVLELVARQFNGGWGGEGYKKRQFNGGWGGEGYKVKGRRQFNGGWGGEGYKVKEKRQFNSGNGHDGY